MEQEKQNMGEAGKRREEELLSQIAALKDEVSKLKTQIELHEATIKQKD